PPAAPYALSLHDALPILIDSRHGLKAIDEEVLGLLDKAAVSYQVVLTKADKIKEPALVKLVEETAKKIVRRPAAFPQVLATSSEDRKSTRLNSSHVKISY